jgi:two-component system phosphoglycerate transport system response regulator PgtA
VKLILVEDNADLALSMRTLLELRGYEVDCYLSAADFLRAAGSLSDRDIVITDYYLPDLNGIELVRQARATRPGVKAILLTGSREEAIVKAAKAVPGCRIEYKPLDYEALERTITQVRGA